MTRARIAIAVLAAAALVALGSVVAVAAPEALGQAASPTAGAGRLEYCPPSEKSRRLNDLKSAQSRAVAQRRAYFARHPSAKDRAAFLRTQQANLKALQQAYSSCG